MILLDGLQVVAVIIIGFTAFFLGFFGLAWINDAIHTARSRAAYKVEQEKKRPPFDDNAEFYKVGNPEMIGVRLFKNGEVVWEGAIWYNHSIHSNQGKYVTQV